MVQKRQFRSHHDDEHYAAAIYRYMREYAIKVKQYCTMVSIDDKHRIKIGKPGYPVAAAERGRRVLVRAGMTFEVGDHDFTKCSIVPSVVLVVDIPDKIEEPWYRGQVYVGYKDASFEPSSPIRHATELTSILSTCTDDQKSILFYSDGGPDHRLTYVSVQLSLIALFLACNLDFLCAARTTPAHSWRNPVERVMSTLNLGLQCVGLMRKEMEPKYKDEAAKCNSLATLQNTAERVEGFDTAIVDSISPVKCLLVKLLERLELKGKKFLSYTTASDTEIGELWSKVLEVDSTLEREVSVTKKLLPTKLGLVAFLEHCCIARHYSFQIKKCGLDTCDICKPVRMSKEFFSKLCFLPDPVPGEENHFKSFEELYGVVTAEEHRPSLHKRPKRQKTLPFSVSVQQCEKH